MKSKVNRPSPAMVVASIAIFLALGGPAVGYSLVRGDGRPGERGKVQYRLRVGKVVDNDTTAGDGQFNIARGTARCKKNERLISGGLRLRGNVFPGQQVSMVESSPAPGRREWMVSLNSDLGGGARQDFVVLAYCRS